MAEVLLLNPTTRKSKKRRNRRGSSTKARQRAGRHSMAKRKRTSRTHRRRAKNRRQHVSGYYPNPARRRRKSNRRSRGYRRNPVGGGMFAMARDSVMPVAVGTMGALALDVAIGALPLPAAVQTGAGNIAVRLAGAVGLGVVASMVTTKQNAGMVVVGAMFATAYGLSKSFLRTTFPTLPGLSGVSAYPRVTYTNRGPGRRLSGPAPAYLRDARRFLSGNVNPMNTSGFMNSGVGEYARPSAF